MKRSEMKILNNKSGFMLVLALVALLPAVFFTNVNAEQVDGTLTITMIPDKTRATVGDNITYNYTIKNNTTFNVTNLSLVDNKATTANLTKTSLIPDESITSQGTYTVGGVDLPGPLTNIVTVTGLLSNGSTVTVNASATVNLYNAILEVTKEANKNSASPHEIITYNYTITNKGTAPLTNISLVDDKLGDIVHRDILSVNESITATKQYEVIVDDLPGPLVNIATVQATDPAGKLVSAKSKIVSVILVIDKTIMTKAEILRMSGVTGKGIDKAPGLQKPFNAKSKASEHAGKKEKNKEK